MQSYGPLDVRKMLFQLSRHVRVQLDESLECHPKLIRWKIKLTEHLLNAQIVDILEIEVDHAGVDQETFQESVVFNHLGHLFLHHLKAPKFFIECFLNECTEDFEDRLTV